MERSPGRSGQARRRPAAFLDGKALVLLGRATEELAREGGYLPDAGRIEAAFLAHGYPWRAGGDPYKDAYRRWVEDTPDLPVGTDALLKARARALKARDGEDAAQLRAELAALGVVVREEGGRQYWRRTGSPRRPGPHRVTVLERSSTT